MSSIERARPGAQPPPGREVGPARRLVPALAVAFALLAGLANAGDWRNGLFLLVPVAAFAAWYRWDLPVPVLAAPVIVGTAGALWGGDFEPALFLLALFALVSVAWCEHRPTVPVRQPPPARPSRAPPSGSRSTGLRRRRSRTRPPTHPTRAPGCAPPSGRTR
ncbi:hypothetical protein [Occultella kanbiaonis]|uniref:hypothetical protein n=1 Tax=Occultella kanbiaonis TaxID=2675754 RepID=UPI0013D36353|nr:hypothetical protein [Occultella kanbiaonis]